jgi:hypothetical protein
MDGMVKGTAMTVAFSLFLSFIGAFGSDKTPLLLRSLVFVFIGLGCSVAVAACVTVTELSPWLRRRDLLRRTLICLAMTLLTAMWVWVTLGFGFLGHPRLSMLPLTLFYSFVMSVFMSVLSWAVFRPRQVLVIPAGTSVQPKFVERLPVKLRGAEIYAVEAEDHYLRLHTSRGSDLILMRLSDAIAELEGLEGAQVHRSWWVAKTALADVTRTAGRTVLKLKDGAEAPVSRGNLRPLKEAGWF